VNFSVKLFTIKGNLGFMNNLYHKVAVASVCTALGFALGANPEAKAASFNLGGSNTFVVMDSNYFGHSFDGLGDLVFPALFDVVSRGISGEDALFIEFNLSLPIAPNTIFSSAVFQVQIHSLEGFNLRTGLGINDYINPGSLGLFGHVGNGIPEIADRSYFEAGEFLNSLDISSSSVGDILSFDVTSFVNQRVSNGDTFAGFGIRALNNGSVSLQKGEFSDGPPRLIVETAEPVPEPATIFGSALALGVGGWLKRKKSSQQHKTTSQH
jgi:hypothetical protein